MWVMLSDAFLSIVVHPNRRNTMVVRARKAGDIEMVFPGVRVQRTPDRDYAYRAFIRREQVAQAMADEVRRIDYGNFKNSVMDAKRHDAYLSVWSTMYHWGTGLGWWRSYNSPIDKEVLEHADDAARTL